MCARPDRLTVVGTIWLGVRACARARVCVLAVTEAKRGELRDWAGMLRRRWNGAGPEARGFALAPGTGTTTAPAEGARAGICCACAVGLSRVWCTHRLLVPLSTHVSHVLLSPCTDDGSKLVYPFWLALSDLEAAVCCSLAHCIPTCSPPALGDVHRLYSISRCVTATLEMARVYLCSHIMRACLGLHHPFAGA
jgi:hypothetical protein